MKLKFKQHKYQADATNAIVNIFSGQTKCKKITKRTMNYTKQNLESLNFTVEMET